MTLPQHKSVQKSRRVNEIVPDEEKRQEIDRKIKIIKEQLEKNSDFKTLEEIGNVAVKLHDAKNHYNDLLSETHNANEIKRLVATCKKNLASYPQYDKEISRLTKEFKSANKTSDRWKDTYEKITKQ